MHRAQDAIVSIVAAVLIVLAGRVVGKPTEVTNSSFSVCTSKCHPQQGICQESGKCICFRGWEGDTCSQCSLPAGCVHGTCRRPQECHCKVGYGGRHCQLDLQYCQRHQPCVNGAACENDGTGSYICACAPGYTGINCDLSLSPSSEPSKPLCLNGGTCRSLRTTGGCERCVCSRGFAGYRCERPVHLCATHPCTNGGSCVNLKGGFKCICMGGYRGRLCDEDVDECERLGERACLNGGVCMNRKGSYRCTCPEGFQGSRCSKKVMRFTTTSQGLLATMKLPSEDQDSKTKTYPIINLKTSSRPQVGREQKKPQTPHAIGTPGGVESEAAEHLSKSNVVVVKHVINNNVVLPPGPSRDFSIAQGVTFALLGVAFVLFAGIAVFSWIYCNTKTLRNDCCVKLSETGSHTDEEQDNRTAFLLDHETNEKSIIYDSVGSRPRSCYSVSVASPGGLLNTTSRPLSGEFLHVALSHETTKREKFIH